MERPKEKSKKKRLNPVDAAVAEGKAVKKARRTQQVSRSHECSPNRRGACCLVCGPIHRRTDRAHPITHHHHQHQDAVALDASGKKEKKKAKKRLLGASGSASASGASSAGSAASSASALQKKKKKKKRAAGATGHEDDEDTWEGCWRGDRRLAAVMRGERGVF